MIAKKYPVYKEETYSAIDIKTNSSNNKQNNNDYQLPYLPFSQYGMFYIPAAVVTNTLIDMA